MTVVFKIHETPAAWLCVDCGQATIASRIHGQWPDVTDRVWRGLLKRNVWTANIIESDVTGLTWVPPIERISMDCGYNPSLVADIDAANMGGFIDRVAADPDEESKLWRVGRIPPAGR